MKKPNFKFYLTDNYCLEVKKVRGIGNMDFALIPLHQVSVKQLEKLRDSKASGFVLKQSNAYYYAGISDFKDCRVIIEETTPHQCAECHHLSAAADKDGGCAKVRAFSRCIEQFDWITHGYETFGTKSDVFIVFNCKNWIQAIDYPTHPITRKQKVMLAQFLWDNIDNYDDVQVMMEKAKKA